MILGVCIAALSFTSCKKDYTCTCTSYESGVEIASASAVLENISKSDAVTACDVGDITYGTASVDCEIE